MSLLIRKNTSTNKHYNLNKDVIYNPQNPVNPVNPDSERHEVTIYE